MNNMAFCTLTYGEKYVKLGDVLIKQITDLGYHMYVYTNEPNHYRKNKMVTVLKYTKPYFSFHEKRVVVKECLKYFETAVFLDADVVLHEVENLEHFEIVEGGLHIFSTFGNIGDTFCSNDVVPYQNMNQRNTKYGAEGIEFLESLNLMYKREYHGIPDYLEHYLEGRWLIKRDNGIEDIFFEIWDKVSEFSEKKDIELGFEHCIGAGEGSAMSIASFNSGIRTLAPSYLCGYVIRHFISNYQEKLDGTKPWDIAG